MNTNVKRDTCSFLLVTKRGFTLIEVMIALSIVGALLVTLIYTLNYNLGIAERHETITVAAILARDKISEIEKRPVDSRGEFPEPYSDYQYETTVKESVYPNISEISVVIRKGKEEVKLSELIQSSK
ncbi:MAG: type II secretion system protein [Nitrospirota bacterium]